MSRLCPSRATIYYEPYMMESSIVPEVSGVSVESFENPTGYLPKATTARTESRPPKT